MSNTDQIDALVAVSHSEEQHKTKQKYQQCFFANIFICSVFRHSTMAKKNGEEDFVSLKLHQNRHYQKNINDNTKWYFQRRW